MTFELLLSGRSCLAMRGFRYGIQEFSLISSEFARRIDLTVRKGHFPISVSASGLRRS